MRQELIVAGFGGQGVMLIGQLLCYSGMMEDKNVSWIPSYGPEMRGGTANCGVLISDEDLGSPVVTAPSSVIAMNRPSMEKFGAMLRANGLLVYNSSLVHVAPVREDIRAIPVPANDIAAELGNPKIANMVLLGAFVGATGVLLPESVEKGLTKILGEKKADLVPVNMQALARGLALAN